jgi:hypothetical protein
MGVIFTTPVLVLNSSTGRLTCAKSIGPISPRELRIFSINEIVARGRRSQGNAYWSHQWMGIIERSRLEVGGERESGILANSGEEMSPCARAGLSAKSISDDSSGMAKCAGKVAP